MTDTTGWTDGREDQHVRASRQKDRHKHKRTVGHEEEVVWVPEKR